MTNLQSSLKNSVNRLVQFLQGEISKKEYLGESTEGTEAQALLNYTLEITYKIKPDRELLDFELYQTIGGPNIWCDSKFVYGRWGSERIDMNYIDGIGLFEAVDELYQNTTNIA